MKRNQVENDDKSDSPLKTNDVTGENLLDLGIDAATCGSESLSMGSGARLSFLSEAEVRDISEMTDLQLSVKAFEQQNAFLNKEVIDLQAMIKGLENREKDLIRKNFDLEAMFYQLKSKYLLLLNHFKPSKAGLNESEIETLIEDATRWPGIAASNPESLGRGTAEDSERSSTSNNLSASEITDKGPA